MAQLTLTRVGLLAFGCAVACAARELPEGTLLKVRLMHPLGTYSTWTGAEVESVLIAPVRAGGHTLLPLGTRIRGVVKQSRQVGAGLLWETARLWLDFNRLEVGGKSVPFETRLLDLDNSREAVDDQGRIRGIRSTDTMGFKASNFLSGLVMFDPIAYLHVNVASARVLRFAEPEILLPVGAEMTVRVAKAAALPDIPSRNPTGFSRWGCATSECFWPAITSPGSHR